MKLIILLLITNFSLTSIAATWEQINIEDSTFSLLKELDLHKSVYKLNSKKENEDFINSLKQMTYISRYDNWGYYSIPNKVNIHIGNLDFSSLTSDNTRTEPAAISNNTIISLTEFLMIDTLDIDIYEGSDGNKDGDCGNVYLHEKKSKEVALLSICYFQ